MRESPQTARAAPRPLPVVHGTADTRLPYTCGVQIYDWAQEPKQLVLYEGAEHHLDQQGHLNREFLNRELRF